MIDAWLEVLVCPLCRGDLRHEGDWLVCPACRRRYPVEDGLPVLLADRSEAVGEDPVEPQVQQRRKP